MARSRAYRPNHSIVGLEAHAASGLWSNGHWSRTRPGCRSNWPCKHPSQRPNSRLNPTRDSSKGFFQIPLNMKNGARTTVRNFIAETFQETYPLTVTQNCHITNNMFDTSGSTPKATRINFLDSNNLYCGSPLSAGQGTPGSATASKEVMIPGGAFKSQISATPLELYSTYRINTRLPSM